MYMGISLKAGPVDHPKTDTQPDTLLNTRPPTPFSVSLIFIIILSLKIICNFENAGISTSWPTHFCKKYSMRLFFSRIHENKNDVLYPETFSKSEILTRVVNLLRKRLMINKGKLKNLFHQLFSY